MYRFVTEDDVKADLISEDSEQHTEMDSAASEVLAGLTTPQGGVTSKDSLMDESISRLKRAAYYVKVVDSGGVFSEDTTHEGQIVNKEYVDFSRQKTLELTGLMTKLNNSDENTVFSKQEVATLKKIAELFDENLLMALYYLAKKVSAASMPVPKDVVPTISQIAPPKLTATAPATTVTAPAKTEPKVKQTKSFPVDNTPKNKNKKTKSYEEIPSGEVFSEGSKFYKFIDAGYENGKPIRQKVPVHKQVGSPHASKALSVKETAALVSNMNASAVPVTRAPDQRDGAAAPSPLFQAVLQNALK